MNFGYMSARELGWDTIRTMAHILSDTLNIKWARVFIDMDQFRQFQVDSYAIWDSMIGHLTEAGVDVILTLHQSDTNSTTCTLKNESTWTDMGNPETFQEWYNYPPTGLEYTYADTANNRWAGYLHNIIDHYGPDGVLNDTVEYYEIWNELNSLGDTVIEARWNYPLKYYDIEYPPDSVTPGDSAAMCDLYTRMVLVSDSVLKGRYGSIPYFLVTNAVYMVNGTHWSPEVRVQGKDWVRMYLNSIGNDDPGYAISIHPYQWPDQFEGRFNPDSLARDVDSMRRVIQDPEMKLWLTELGWSTEDEKITEELQANYLVESYVTGLGMAEEVLYPLERMFWWVLNDDVGGGFNIVNNDDLSKKKGFYACKQMVSQLCSMKYCQLRNLQTWGPDSNIDFIERGRCYEFEDKDGDLRKWVLWKNAGGEVDSILVKLPVATNQVDKVVIDYTDGTGDSLRMDTGYDGYFGLTVKENPVYVKEFGTTSLCDLKVDSIWPVPEPQDSVKFVLYAKIKNIGNEAAPTDSYPLLFIFSANDTLVLDSISYTDPIPCIDNDSIVIMSDTLILYNDGAPYLLKGHANFDKNFNEQSFENNAGFRFCECRYPLKKAITYPVDSQQVSGTIQVQGWVYDPNGDFWKYTLYYYDDGTGEWHGCDPDSVSYTPVNPISSPGGPSGGDLGDWNTNTVTNGEYDLKLTVYDTLGHQADTTIIDVYVFNDPFGGGDGFGGMGAPSGLGYADSLIFVGDLAGEVIAYDLEGAEVDRFAVDDSSGSGTPTGLLLSNYLWVVDEKHENLKGYKDKKVKKKIKVKEPRFITDGIWVTSGDYLLRIDDEGKIKTKVEVKRPRGLYGYEDYLLVLLDKSNKLLWIDTTGQVIDTTFAEGLTNPSHLTVDEHRFVYIADSARVGVYDFDGSLLFALPVADPGWLLRFGPYLYVSFADHVQRYQLFGKPWQPGGGPQSSGEAYFFSFRTFPNPFPRALNIVYSLAKKTRPKVTVFDVTGRRVRSYDYGEKEPGFHQAIIKPRLPNGVYFLRFEAGNYKKTDKVVLVR